MSAARIDLLRNLLARALAQESDAVARAPFLRAIFGVGIAHLGGSIDDLVAAVERETEVAPPNVILLELYFDFAHRPRRAAAEDDAAVKAVIDAIASEGDRFVVNWLVERSSWLSARGPSPEGLRPALERTLASTTPATVLEAAGRLWTMRGLYDYEIATAARRLVDVAVGSGDRELMRETASVLVANADRIKIRAHRIRFLSACSRVLGPTGDAATAAQIVDAVVSSLSASGRPPSARDVVVPSRALVDQLAHVEHTASLTKLLHALVERATKDEADVVLLALAAGGFALLHDTGHAKAMLADARDALPRQASHLERFLTAAELCDAVARLPFRERVGECEALVELLPLMKDTFTTSPYFAAHQLLLAEKIVDAVVHDVDEGTAT